ncbi:MAG: hypothetical protein LBL26_01760 [Peptococcaceae bacterium]|jgi:hypothetical protein|nr:hypothetical protein [Peptococcaceae bacterium]
MSFDLYDIVWPSGKCTVPLQKLAKRLDTLEGKVVAELWSWTFKGDIMFNAFEAELSRLYPGIQFISWREFGEIHGANEREVLDALPEKLKRFGVDAAITGVGGGASGVAADVRCSILVENLGIPTVTVVTDSFLSPGKSTAKGLGMPNLPFTSHPGHSLLAADEQVYKNAAGIMTGEVVQGLTAQPAEINDNIKEPEMRDIIFSGTFEEVNRYFYTHEFSDGLPIVPPTIEKVEEFLKFTDRSAAEVVGVVQPDMREATLWNIAVNGVMSGCRPEYMPVLVSIIEAMLIPEFAQEHLGHSPGMEDLIIINGKIIKDLDFNYTQGVFRPGPQSNTSIGRFWRMYLHNVATFVLHKADKSTFGDGFRNILAENEDFAASVGWEPMSTDWGCKPGDNLITLTSFTEKTQAIQVGAPTAEGVLENIEKRMADNNLFIEHFFRGVRTRPVVILPPNVVRILADAGYTRAKVKQHFYENARVKLSRLGTAALTRFYEGIDAGNWPEQIGSTKDLDRYVQMVSDPDAFQIVVSGDNGRDHVLIGAQNGVIGPPVCKKIELPANWDALLSEAKKI